MPKGKRRERWKEGGNRQARRKEEKKRREGRRKQERRKGGKEGKEDGELKTTGQTDKIHATYIGIRGP